MGRKTFAWMVIAGMLVFGLQAPVTASEPHQHNNPQIMPAAPPGTNPADQDKATLASMQPIAAAMNHCMIPQMDPHMVEGEKMVLDLVPYAAVTHTYNNATGNGLWSDAKNWANGALPTDGANVLIEAGKTVLVDQVVAARLNTVRVDGTLTYATDRDTGLLVFTMVVTCGGKFIMGDKDNPIGAAYEAKLTFDGVKETDLAEDPMQFGRGFISMQGSEVSIVGSYKTSSVTLDGSVLKGTTMLTLDTAPTGWQVGDVLVLAGTASSGGIFQSEEFLLKSINGNMVELDHVTAYDHLLPTDPVTGMPYKIDLANITRNAAFQGEYLSLPDASGKVDPMKAAHAMIQHNQNAYVENFGTYGLGRTDKQRPLFSFDPNDADYDGIPDANDPEIGPIASNQVGRYAFHFHRAGIDSNSAPGKVKNIVIVASAGLGLNNHSSYIEAEDITGYKNTGATIFTEEGDEIGFFRNGLVIGATKPGPGTDGFSKGVNAFNQSFGTQSGVWLQGNDVVVSNVRLADGARFVAFTRPLQDGTPVRHTDGPLDINGVYIYGGGNFETKFHRLNDRGAVKSHIRNVTILNGGLTNAYTRHTVFENFTIYTSGIGVSRNDVTGHNTYRGFTIDGWQNRPVQVGIQVPVNGANVVENSIITAVVGLQITNAMSMNRSVNINNVTFPTIDPALLGGKTQYAIDLISSVNFKDANLNQLFREDPVLMTDTLNYNNKQLYWSWQNPDSVPFAGKTLTGIAELDGKTAQELWDAYGLALGGTLAPSDYRPIAQIRGGGVGSPTEYRPRVTVKSPTFTNKGQYVLSAVDSNGNRYTGSEIQLIENAWNLVTYEIGGQKHTYLVYYDTVAPTIQANPFDINPLDIEAGAVFKFQYSVVDKIGIFEIKEPGKVKIDLSKVTILTDSQTGQQYFEVMLAAKDAAGNTTQLAVRFNINASAPRLTARSPGFKPRTAPKASTRYMSALLLYWFQRILLIP